MLNKLELLSQQLRKVATLEVAEPRPIPSTVEIQKTASVFLDVRHVTNFVKFFTV